MLFMLYVMTECSGHKLSFKHLSKTTENTYRHYIFPNKNNLQKNNDFAELRPQICDYMYAKII